MKDTWLQQRLGKLTASRMKDAMQCRHDYMMEFVTERLTGVSTWHYVTPAMQWGIEQESHGPLHF